MTPGNLNDKPQDSQQTTDSIIEESVVNPHVIIENKGRRNNSVIITIIICATVIVLCVLGFILYYAVLDKESSVSQSESVEMPDDRSDRDRYRDDDNRKSRSVQDEEREEASENNAIDPFKLMEQSNSHKPDKSAAEPKKVPNRQQAAAILANVGLSEDYSYIICEVPLEGSDLQHLTKAQLRILRNTIYARHGRKFKSADLHNYFSNFPWYTPLYDEISPNALSSVEKHNIQLIQKYE